MFHQRVRENERERDKRVIILSLSLYTVHLLKKPEAPVRCVGEEALPWKCSRWEIVGVEMMPGRGLSLWRGCRPTVPSYLFRAPVPTDLKEIVMGKEGERVQKMRKGLD